MKRHRNGILSLSLSLSSTLSASICLLVCYVFHRSCFYESALGTVHLFVCFFLKIFFCRVTELLPSFSWQGAPGWRALIVVGPPFPRRRRLLLIPTTHSLLSASSLGPRFVSSSSSRSSSWVCRCCCGFYEDRVGGKWVNLGLFSRVFGFGVFHCRRRRDICRPDRPYLCVNCVSPTCVSAASVSK